jgi:hypothetical protein
MAEQARIRTSAVLLLGAVAFFVIFYVQLSSAAPAHYSDRDDAVITLSHARNLAQYGFIGVSPSGERVEGFSAPLQFWVAFVCAWISPFEYTTFFRWQTLVGTLALGVIFAGVLYSARGPHPSRSRDLFVAFAVVSGAQILASSRAFLWWHASGMENVYKSIALLALIWALDTMLRSARIIWPAVLLVFAAAITRIDAIIPVSLLLATFAVIWCVRHRNARALLFVATSLLLWMAFMAWRWSYFGQWEPNTAAAQGISVAARIGAAARSPLNALVTYESWFRQVGASLFAFQLLWLIPIAISLRRNTLAGQRLLLITTGVVSCVIQYALFGPARMDIARTVTEMALYATMGVPFVLLASDRFERHELLAGTAILASSVLVATLSIPDRSEIGWPASAFEVIGDEMERLASEYDIPRPLVANPDLGAISWRKHFNIIDVGRLGSAAIPRVASPSVYVTSLAIPDIIELHYPWACEYRDLFTAQFAEDYVRVSPPELTPRCPGGTGNRPTYWVRRAVMAGSASSERHFLDAFRRSFDIGLVETELATCRAANTPRPCAYVGSTLFRFVPELKRRRLYDRVADLLGRDARLSIERAFFTSSTDPHWWRALDTPVLP